MEKILQKKTLQEFSQKKSPWLNKSYSERLSAMAEICGTTAKHGKVERGLYRVYTTPRKK